MGTGKEIKLDESTNQTKCMNCGEPYKWNTDQFLNEKIELNRGKMVICGKCHLSDKELIYLARRVEALRQERAK